MTRAWTEQDITRLRAMKAKNMTAEAVAARLGRSASAVQARAHNLVLTRDRRVKWDDVADNVLRVMWTDGASSGEIAKKLNRTRGAVAGRVQRLGLTRKLNGAPTVHAKPPAAVRKPRKPKAQRVPPAIAKPVAEPEDAPAILKSAIWRDLPGTAPVPLEQATGCKWPVEMPGREHEHLFCNEPIHPEGARPHVYCLAHRHVAHPKPDRP